MSTELNSHSSEAALKPPIRLPLAVDGVSVGAMDIFFGRESLPERLKLYHDHGSRQSQAFEIRLTNPADWSETIRPAQLAASDLEQTSHDVLRLLTEIGQQVRSAHIIRAQPRYSTRDTVINGESYQIHYESSHIPDSLEELSARHERHHITAFRRSILGVPDICLETNSLSYPDGSMKVSYALTQFLDGVIIADRQLQVIARSSESSKRLLNILYELHEQILSESASVIMMPYRISQNDGGAPVLFTNSETLNSKSRIRNTSSPRKEQEKRFIDIPQSGFNQLSSGSMIRWNYLTPTAEIEITPFSSSPSRVLSIHGRYAKPSEHDFFKLIDQLCSESPSEQQSAVRTLLGHYYARNTGDVIPRTFLRFNSDILMDRISESLPRGKLYPIDPSPLSQEKIFSDLLTGYEWIGFERAREISHIKDVRSEIPHLILLSVWQGGCNEIRMYCDAGMSMSISNHSRDLLSGTIPEMVCELNSLLSIFAKSPFSLCELLSRRGHLTSQSFDCSLGTEIFSLLGFYSDFFDTIAPHTSVRYLSPEPVHYPLSHIARNPDYITIEIGGNHPYHIDSVFEGTRLAYLSVQKRPSKIAQLLLGPEDFNIADLHFAQPLTLAAEDLGGYMNQLLSEINIIDEWTPRYQRASEIRRLLSEYRAILTSAQDPAPD